MVSLVMAFRDMWTVWKSNYARPVWYGWGPMIWLEGMAEYGLLRSLYG